MSTSSLELKDWVDKVARLTQPQSIHWCDGSEGEYQLLVKEMLGNGTLISLNQDTNPGSYLHRSDSSDVARTEHLTFVCSKNQDDAGPNNNWLPPSEAHRRIDALFEGAMRGRRMYVVPYCMGPINSPLARVGVEITDSPYVVISMRKMTRMGLPALKRIEGGEKFVKGLHSLGDLDPNRRFIMHFPEELTIKSIGSGYGGNALLGKKCHALRIASAQARQEGWLAEHMLILGIRRPNGITQYVAAAFPSQCGKTNLAMLIPPKSMEGYEIFTVGDDIAWMHPGQDGALYAINPEAGFFGVAPGTSHKTNPTALQMIGRDTIFTNVAMTSRNEPWWEGKSDEVPKWDWQGRPYDSSQGPAAHPNSRFTVSMNQCPTYTDRAEDPKGVPISAIIFGGRRAALAPLVYQARDWQHGVLVGATMASETTAAATGKVGVVRRDPMAMQPFCGYNFADYWGHWLDIGNRLKQAPKIFHVNWFRQDENGRFLWPGFGENLRVLNWILDRCNGTVGAKETPIGYLPNVNDIPTSGLNVQPKDIEALLQVDNKAWAREFDETGDYLDSYGARLPAALREEHQRTRSKLG